MKGASETTKLISECMRVNRDNAAIMIYWRERALAAEKELHDLKAGMAQIMAKIGNELGST